MQTPASSAGQPNRTTRRVLTSALVLVSLFCLLTSLLLAGGAYLFLRPGGLLDQSGLEEDLPDPGVPPASFPSQMRWAPGSHFLPGYA